MVICHQTLEKLEWSEYTVGEDSFPFCLFSLLSRES